VKILLAADGKIIIKEKELSIDDVPLPAKETLLKEAGKNDIKGIKEITRDGKRIYKGKWSDKGNDVGVVVTSDGKIESTTKQIGIDDVPKAVKETVLEKAGSNKIKEVEMTTEGDKTTYEAKWMENGKAIRLKVSPDGKIISKEPNEAEKEKSEKEKDKKEVSAGTEEYEEVNPSELSFVLRDYNYEGVVAAGGGVEPIGGHIGQFLCEGQPLELASDKFEDGFIITKHYGKVKVIFSASLMGESFSVYLTSKQKEALIALKKKNK
jgi:hypothetical protein